MVALSTLILASPFALAYAISRSPGDRDFVRRHQRACLAVGWSALVLVVPAALAFDGVQRIAALLFLCPLIALSFAPHAGDDGDDDGRGRDDGPEAPDPDGPEVDWDRFEDDFATYVREREALLTR
jgi:hypothetical protein